MDRALLTYRARYGRSENTTLTSTGQTLNPANAEADRKLFVRHKNGGCAVNGTSVATVSIDQSRSFVNLHIRYVHWIAARLPNCKIWGFCCQHLATLATPTIKCKQSPVYGVFYCYFHIPLPILTKHELGLPFPARNLPIKFVTNPSTIFLVIVVTTIVLKCTVSRSGTGQTDGQKEERQLPMSPLWWRTHVVSLSRMNRVRRPRWPRTLRYGRTM